MSSSERYPPGFFLAVVANQFFFTSFQWTFATLPGYIQTIGGDPALIGLAFGLFTLSAVAVRPALGRLIDRWGCKPMMLAGALIFTLSPLLYALLPWVWPFMVVRLLHGVGIAAFTTAYIVLVTGLAPPRRRGEAVGLAGITNNLGMLLAPALGVLVQVKWGYAAHFFTAAGMGAVSLVLLLPVAESRGSGAADTIKSAMWAVARQRPIWVAALGSTGLAVAYGAVLSFMAPFAAERGLSAAGTYFTVFAAAMIVVQALAGWLSDRIGRKAVATPGLAAVALAIAGLAAARTNAALLAAGAGLGLSWGLVRASLDTSVVDAAAPLTRGTALAFLYTCFDIGVGAGSFGLGIAAQAQGYTTAFFCAALWAAVALAGYLLWGGRTR
jgi:MFS family permease